VEREIRFTINGDTRVIRVPANRLLVDLVREDLGLTGTKMSCGLGECGSCTVLLDGRAVNSCLVLAVEVDGCEIETIEGLSRGKCLHPLQEAFVEHGAVQCGFCTPGMIMSAEALRREVSRPTEKEIKDSIAGNICRCTGYVKIVDAIRSGVESEGG
jgi:aerobic-type carbon monoxide dehydrogenase small subunit (CoxS/CutS family)